MKTSHSKYLIIGNGIAGLCAAEEIRKKDDQGDITLLSAEPFLTYFRVKLSHMIGKGFQEPDLLVHDAQWYAQRSLSVRLGERVQAIDFASRELESSQEKYSWETLLLANGSSSFVPPVVGSEKAGVFSLRTLQDLRAFQQFLTQCSTVTVVGGGLLGLEAAWSLHEMGKKVRVVEFFPYCLNRQLDEPLARELESFLQKEGLEIFSGKSIQAIGGTEKVHSVLLQDGEELASDAVLFSAGIRSNLALYKDSPLTLDRGVVVDARMRTGVENVFAAGDVAEANGTVLGLWSAAMAQGRVAGRNMCGGQEEYLQDQPFTLLQIGGMRLFSVGSTKGSQVFEWKHPTKRDRVKLFLEEGKLVGGILVGNTTKMIPLRNAVMDRRDLSGFLDPSSNGLLLLGKL